MISSRTEAETDSNEAHGELRRLYEKAILIRAFEERLFKLHGEGRLSGTMHTCIGQEFSGIALAEALRPGDRVFSNHRCHGHYIARTGDVDGLLAEILGKRTGPCAGRGGTQHICAGGFYSNGIQGGLVPVAAGAALAERLRQSGNIVAVFIGDGTLGQGIVYETLNIAALWSLPLLIVCENNLYAQSTPQAQGLSGSIDKRAAAFGIVARQTATWEPPELMACMREAVESVRKREGPVFVRVDTYRLMPHSKGDEGRDPRELERYQRRDPINRFAEAHAEDARELAARADARLDEALRKATDAPRACVTRDDADPAGAEQHVDWFTPELCSDERIGVLIRDALEAGLRRHEELLLLGEDIEAPYGGAFKITRELSDRFAGRVRNTPISESAVAGIGNGLALSGMKPVCEIMFGDFLPLAADQIINHASKFKFMYNNQISLPLIVRTPMGGKRGYGPTHSQSLEKHFLGLPQTLVLALNGRVDPRPVYEELFRSLDRLCLMVENKILYTRRLSGELKHGFRLEHSRERFPAVRIARGGQPDLTVVCYGGMLDEVEEAAFRAFEQDNVVCEIICPLQLYPLNHRAVLESVRRSGRLLIVEEGHGFAGFGSELLARVAEDAPEHLGAARRLCAPPHPIPSCAALENELLPSAASILDAIDNLVRGSGITEVRAAQENANDDSLRILQWMVQDGAHVEQDAVLLEAETSKAAFEVTAPKAGFVRILAPAGADVPVGEPLCLLGSDLSALDRRERRQPVAESAPQPAPDEIFGMMAADRSLAASAPPSTPSPSRTVRIVPAEPAGAPAARTPTPWQAVPIPPEKQAEISYLSTALRQALPSAVTVAVQLPRQSRSSDGETGEDSILSETIYEAARLLRKYRAFNACCDEAEMRFYSEVHIGFALDAGRGLRVPVIRDADNKSVEDIEAEKQECVISYLDGSLASGASDGGTFTITDLSSEGVLHFSPMLNRGQSAILGVSRGAPNGCGDPVWNLTLVFDHRAAEGRLAARFLNELKERLAARRSRLAGAAKQPDEEPCCRRCYRSAGEVRDSGHYLLRAIGPTGKDEIVCTMCVSGW